MIVGLFYTLSSVWVWVWGKTREYFFNISFFKKKEYHIDVLWEYLIIFNDQANAGKIISDSDRPKNENKVMAIAQ